jgi:hypothetical protein
VLSICCSPDESLLDLWWYRYKLPDTHTQDYTGYHKISVHLMITIQVTPLSQHTPFLPHHLAQSDCLAVDHRGQGDTKLTLMPSLIPDSHYVIMVRD